MVVLSGFMKDVGVGGFSLILSAGKAAELGINCYIITHSQESHLQTINHTGQRRAKGAGPKSHMQESNLLQQNFDHKRCRVGGGV